MASEYLITASQSQAPTTSYLTNDTLGSPRVVTDASGNVTSRRDFMPYGEEIPRANQGADKVRQKFTSYERDIETELDFAQARMYSSKLGRFSTTDPANIQAMSDVTIPQSWNAYSYVNNQPTKLTDPNGECPWCEKIGNKLRGFGFITNADKAEELAKRRAEVQAYIDGGSTLVESSTGKVVESASKFSDLSIWNAAETIRSGKIQNREEYGADAYDDIVRQAQEISILGAPSGTTRGPASEAISKVGGSQAIKTFLGWGNKTTITKTAADFTKEQLIKNGYTKEVLQEIYTGLMEVAKKTIPRSGELNPASVARANQVKELLETFFK